MPVLPLFSYCSLVAPARERGLKYQQQHQAQYHSRRSREGAWIEIAPYHYQQLLPGSLP